MEEFKIQIHTINFKEGNRYDDILLYPHSGLFKVNLVKEQYVLVNKETKSINFINKLDLNLTKLEKSNGISEIFILKLLAISKSPNLIKDL